MDNNTEHLEQVFDNPGQLADELKAQMAINQDEGEITEEERQEMETAMEVPKTEKENRQKKTDLRGEGGSGLMRRSVEEEIENQVDAHGRSLVAVKDEEEGDDDRSVREWVQGVQSLPDTASKPSTATEFNLYDFVRRTEEGIEVLVGAIAELQARIEKLERNMSVSLPIVRMGPTSHSRENSVQQVGSPPRKGLSARKVIVSAESVAGFLRENSAYPVIKKIRTAKLQALASANSIARPVLDVPVSSWNVQGISQMLENL